jgi:hypothetical protein
VNCHAGTIASTMTGTLSAIAVNSRVRNERSSSTGSVSCGSPADAGGGGSAAV